MYQKKDLQALFDHWNPNQKIMASVINNDILDLGTRKSRRQRGDPMAPNALWALGSPGQFDLPNVADVRLCFLFLCHANVTCVSHFRFFFSLPCIVAATLLLFVELVMKVSLSSSQREQPLSPSNSMAASSLVSTLDPQWEPTFPPEL